MQGGYFSYGLLAGLAIALLVAAFTDLKRREIDNWLTAGIALGAPLFWLAAGLTLHDIAWQLGITLGVSLFLIALFAMGQMGGGDVKLLAALALWLRPLAYLDLWVVMSIAGAALTLGFAGWHLLRKRAGKASGQVKTPYGVAISCGGLWVLACHYFANLPGAALSG